MQSTTSALFKRLPAAPSREIGNNKSNGFGGAVFNQLDSSIPSISNSVFSGNSVTHRGGGLFNTGVIGTISNSSFSGNEARRGGGLYNAFNPTADPGAVLINVIANSTFSGNSATGGVSAAGGGVANDGTVNVITNNTFSGNSATRYGGGLDNDGIIDSITNNTFSGNEASDSAGIENSGSIYNLTDTIITDSKGGGSSCTSLATGNSNGGSNNLIDNNSADEPCEGEIGSITPGSFDAILRNNGCITPGPTGCVKTHALLLGSNAIDPAVSTSSNTIDQRGFNAFGIRDIGAWESSDQDSDGLTEAEEVDLGTDPNKYDTDEDGLSDSEEISYGTNPLKKDTDGDGYSDGDEVNAGTNPLDRNDPDPYKSKTLFYFSVIQGAL